MPCPTCGSSFSLVDDETVTRATERTIVGHFELIRRLGVGAFGSVWQARDRDLDRTVAVKIPRKEELDPAETEKFLREARAAAQLKHPNIVSVHEVGREGGRTYIVSDYVRGVTLSDRLSTGPLGVREAAELCARIRLYDLHSAPHSTDIVTHDGEVGRIATSPSPDYVCTVGDHVRVWDRKSGAPHSVLPDSITTREELLLDLP